ncbi:hypothetical protein MPL3356_300107 [Mesorhizobium plurifarium]|uniref:Uncharacterized protein n=1 Tax=Mesorhizobium plurifarium TaxID=69974 RepID=A0A090DSL3_MESPL|nr:hypothetical protein MPL3356_300107 [Mesorhizobium plurifarium]
MKVDPVLRGNPPCQGRGHDTRRGGIRLRLRRRSISVGRLCRRRDRFAPGFDLLAAFKDMADDLADLHFLTGGASMRDEAGCRSLHLDRGLVVVDLKQRVALRDFGAVVLQPAANAAGVGLQADLRKNNGNGHGIVLGWLVPLDHRGNLLAHRWQRCAGQPVLQFCEQRLQLGHEDGDAGLDGGKVLDAAAGDGHELGSIARPERHADGVDVAVPVAERSDVAMLGVALEPAVDGAAYLIPAVRVVLDQLADDAALQAFLHGGQIGQSHRCLPDRQARTDIEPERDRCLGPAVRDVDHLQPITHAHGDGHAGFEGQGLHQRLGHVDHGAAAQAGVAERYGRRPDGISPQEGIVEEIAEADQRVGEARDRGLGQAGPLDQFLVAERCVGRRERAQDLQAAHQGGRMLSLIFIRWRRYGFVAFSHAASQQRIWPVRLWVGRPPYQSQRAADRPRNEIWNLISFLLTGVDHLVNIAGLSLKAWGETVRHGTTDAQLHRQTQHRDALHFAGDRHDGIPADGHHQG